MIDDLFLYQHKEMLTAKTHTVKRMDLEDLRCNAIDEGRDPCYIIEYDQTQWFMVSRSDYELLKAAKRNVNQ